MSVAGERATVRRAVVHIGSDKTGSTALQAALADRRRELVDVGIWYPDLDGRPDHLGLADRRRPQPPPLPTVAADTMVLSSEALWPLPPRRIARLLDRLADTPGIDEVVVLAYLRAPVDFAEAAFLQRCRMATTERALRRLVALRSLPAPINPIVGRAVDRLAQLGRWGDEVDRLVAGASGVRARLEVRPYRPADWPGGDVVADVVTVPGLEPAAALLLDRPRPRRHPTPDLVTVHASVLVREAAGPEAQTRLLDSSAAGARATGGPGGASGRPVLPPGLRRRIATRTDPLLARLDGRFGGLADLTSTSVDVAGEEVQPFDRTAARALLTERWPEWPTGVPG